MTQSPPVMLIVHGIYACLPISPTEFFITTTAKGSEGNGNIVSLSEDVVIKDVASVKVSVVVGRLVVLVSVRTFVDEVGELVVEVVVVLS